VGFGGFAASCGVLYGKSARGTDDHLRTAKSPSGWQIVNAGNVYPSLPFKQSFNFQLNQLDCTCTSNNPIAVALMAKMRAAG
jgi:hypothetical protein